jgi:tRNA/tmRNA/rRNA uracil-C5-methylase (TrmA/RlmC/RlmD family)
MSLLTLEIEKATAGGRMLARHDGQIVLVSGAIPGERVSARVERAAKGVVYADTVEVLESSDDRRNVDVDRRCGGNVFAHIDYARQVVLKAAIVQDAFGHIAHLTIPPPPITPSPEVGYRMRARLHVQGGRIGFYREGSHELCAAATTWQLLPAAHEWIASAQRSLGERRLAGIRAIDLAENVPGDERACHVELAAGVDPQPFSVLASGLTGLSAQPADRPHVVDLAGRAEVSDWVSLSDATPAVRLRRDVRAFFQGNRFLLVPLVQCVAALVPPGPVLDLYAGVGLFGLALATSGQHRVTAVEADPISSGNLEDNASSCGHRVTVVRRSVEAFVTGRMAGELGRTTLIVDPPRRGLSKVAARHIIHAAPARIVYVSCDVPTLARDARRFCDSGYRLEEIRGMDLFPNTAHVEVVALFTR